MEWNGKIIMNIVSPGYLSDDDLIEMYINHYQLNNYDNKNYLDFFIKKLYAEIKFREIEYRLDEHINKFKKITNNNIQYNCELSPYEQLVNLKIQYSENINNSSLENYPKIIRGGRLTIPKNVQQLWAQHKYSIMARDNNLYKNIGKEVAVNKSIEYFRELALFLANQLAKRPYESGMRNALEHMWGYISDYSRVKKSEVSNLTLEEFFVEIQHSVKLSRQEYLYAQTAIVELGIWIS